ncbi:MAG: 4-alpha-glucanotransferase [Bryobacterales bacterium]|jgi:4-alpha-glucanotransferase|nr:4-alpha-glucanotransferase [Bryobacterales bacterium]
MNPTSVSFEPLKKYSAALERAARLWGVDLTYWDIFGKKHEVSEEVVQAILAALGVDTRDAASLSAAVEQRLKAEWTQPLPTVEVVGLRGDAPAWVNLPAESTSIPLRVYLNWEEGGGTDYTYAASGMEVLATCSIGKQHYVRLRIPLPAETPLGYHTMTVEGGLPGKRQFAASTQLIVTPERAYQPACISDGGKCAGVGVSLYSLRSQRNWGCGDFTDLPSFCGWAAEELGCAFVALNPLHLIANRLPYNASPYLPVSTYFKNFIYLDLERVPEFQRAVWAQRRMTDPTVRQRVLQLRLKEQVDYEGVAELKLGMLALSFLEFRHELRARSPRALAFLEWCASQEDLITPFATFCALDRHMHKRNRDVWVWQDWPREYQDPQSPAVASFANRHKHLVQFYRWVQWLVFDQLQEAGDAARAAGLEIGLYHDLALATDSCGADVWAQRDFFVTGCRVGAPPDDFSPDGQDWAFPPPHAERHRRDAYRMFRESIRRNMLAGGALRIDHVMRFFRLYWIPMGFSAAEGAYVRDDAENLVRILALESVRNQVLVVGEDLGTVEPATRETLEKFGILSYRLFFFERDEAGAMKMPEHYPAEALVATSTHDLPTIAGSWIGRDIEARDYAGLLPDHAVYQHQWAARRDLKQHILDALFAEGLMPDHYTRRAHEIPELTGELHNAVIGYLARTPAKLFQVNQEDLIKQLDQQNLPGSTWQYPNWQRKMAVAVEDLRRDALARGCAAMLHHWLKETGRAR